MLARRARASGAGCGRRRDPRRGHSRVCAHRPAGAGACLRRRSDRSSCYGKAAAHEQCFAGCLCGTVGASACFGRVGVGTLAGRLRHFQCGGLGWGCGGSCALDGGGHAAGYRHELAADERVADRLLQEEAAAEADAPDREDEVEQACDDACPPGAGRRGHALQRRRLALHPERVRAIVIASYAAESSSVSVPAARRSAQPRPVVSTDRSPKPQRSGPACPRGESGAVSRHRRPRPVARPWGGQPGIAQLVLPAGGSAPPGHAAIGIFPKGDARLHQR